MSIVSCAFWPCVCLLWRNVYLDLLSIFLSFLFFFFLVIELYELFVYFGNSALIICIICKYFLPENRLSLHFVYDFL